MEIQEGSQYASTSAITRDIIALMKSHIGRGPTKGKTYFENECILVLLRDAHTTAEGTLADGGRERAVAQNRVDISEDARAGLIEVVESHTNQKVAGFMSSSSQDPSLVSFVFVMESSPLLAAASDEPI